MKNYSIMIATLAFFLFLGCKKDDYEHKIRIRKTSFIKEGKATTKEEFEYNSNNLLTKVIRMNAGGTINYCADITYNNNNLPVSVKITYPLNRREFTFYIEWSNMGFTTYMNSGFKDTYLLNDFNQISTKYTIVKNENMIEYDTVSVTNYKYYEQNKMIVNSNSIFGNTHEVKYILTANPNPFKGINIALVTIIPFYISTLVECQNYYCTSSFSTLINDRETTTTIKYIYNDLGYPLHAYIRYEDNINSERLFEYESY